MMVIPATAPSARIPAPPMARNTFESTDLSHIMDKSRAPTTATANAQTIVLGTLGSFANNTTATMPAMVPARRGRIPEIRAGKRRANHITTPPSAIAAKKVTPKYQKGKSRPFQSFHRALKIPGSRSGRMLGSG